MTREDHEAPFGRASAEDLWLVLEGRRRSALHVAEVVQRRLRSNGDWNINDWKDVAGMLADYVLLVATVKDSRTDEVGAS